MASLILELMKGQSYEVTITNIELGEMGQAGYSAALSGNGFVIEDPANTLGGQWSDSDARESKSATIHVPLVTLTMSKKTMTLKHDNQCALTISTKPDALQGTDHEVRISFADVEPWRSLGSGESIIWKTGVAVNFKLQAKTSINGEIFYSKEKFATVQFPTRTQILSDAGIVAAMEAEWQETLNASTPQEYKEMGFAIMLNTITDEYYVTHEEESGGVAPGEDTEILWFNLPSDGKTEPHSSGTHYFVGLFHTHPPYEFAPTNNPWRYAGYSTGSDGDVAEANEAGIPSFVYDYITNDGKVYPGHPEDSPAKVYEYGPIKKVRCYYEE